LVLLICILMIVSTTVLITPEDFQVLATGGGSASVYENYVGINKQVWFCF
jgi:hypothetical protein